MQDVKEEKARQSICSECFRTSAHNMLISIDLQSDVFYTTYGGKLSLAQFTNPGKVLDFGTGSGAWAIKFGRR